jgi:AAA ATPase domain
VSAQPFVGRERELAELRAALAAALGGRKRLVLVSGEPGIGKTRVAEVAAAEAADSGVPVWWGRGWEDGTAPAFWPWNTALRGWVERSGDEAVLAAAGPLAADLARVFPALQPGTPEPPEPATESEPSRFRLFDAVNRFLAALARTAGLVLVLDDVQWADAASLKLLEFVAADVLPSRLLLVATYRDTEVRREHPFFRTLSRLVSEPLTRRLALSGLSPGECGRYVGLASETNAAEALGEVLHGETAGNPLFLGELMRLLASEGGLDPAGRIRPLPPGIREVVALRLERLGEECRRLLAVAALVGDTFEGSCLEALLQEPSRSLEASVADVLERAVRERILIELDGPARRYAFAHALVRRVFIDESDPSERAAWHGRIAAQLERAAGPHAATLAAQLVWHFAAAGTEQALRKAFTYACSGADQAVRGLGWEAAVRLYTIALELGSRCGALGEEGTIELQLALARALRRAGNVTGARARCREAADDCRRVGRPDLLVRAALIHAGLFPDEGRVDPEARAALEEACQVVDGVDDSLRARLCARLAWDIAAANETEQLDRAVALGAEAVDAARRAGDSGALALALLRAYDVATAGPSPPAGRARASVPSPAPPLREILRVAESAGELELAAQIRHTRAMDCFAAGDAEGFFAEHDALAALAASSRVPEALWTTEIVGAMRATVEGRFAEGRLSSDQALETGCRMQLANAVEAHLDQQIMWYALQGRLAECLPLLSESVARRPERVVWRPFLALARLAAGDEPGARAEFASLVAEASARGEHGVHACAHLAGLAALCVGLRDREEAAVLYDWIAKRSESWVVTGWATLGPWALARGSLARLCGRASDAAAHFAEAIWLGRQMRSRPVVAHAQSLLAAVWLSADPDASMRARALAALGEAEPVARELGLVDVLARTERMRDGLRRRYPAGGNLFRREGDFWTLRYAGSDVRVKDTKGMRYLAMLLASPGRELHVLRLAGAAPPSSLPRGTLRGLTLGGFGQPLDDAPDARARREYRKRLLDLRDELEEAERFGDLGRTGRLRAEIEHLVVQLTMRRSKSGRSNEPAEKARKAVAKALRTQIVKLAAEHRALGRHLSESIHTGTFCVYDPPAPVEWETGGRPSP